MSGVDLMKALDNEAYIILLEDKLEAKDKRIEELEEALLTYGRHHRTCSRWDKLNIGPPFIRTKWPCDCGLGKALGESK